MVLYTDCDVMFLRQPVFPGRPVLFAATTEFSDDPSDLNSGVMVMNLVSLRQVLDRLQEFTRSCLHLGLDQEILKAFFGPHYVVLDKVLNWRPYWGFNPAAQILHFHGPKPAVARRFAIDGALPAHNSTWSDLLQCSPSGYEAYARQWYLFRERFGAPVPAGVS